MARIVMVPGLAVRDYLQPSAEALRRDGHDVSLADPLGWRRSGSDLRRYARRLAASIRAGEPADLLIGLSVGTQAAALAAADPRVARRVLLVSPTIDPARRSRAASLAIWLRGEGHRDSPRWSVQAQDWVRAGLSGIDRGLRSAIAVRLEDELGRVAVPITLLHAEADRISSLPYAVDLADRFGARLLIMPDAPHSWPVHDDDRFRRLVAELVAGQPASTG